MRNEKQEMRGRMKMRNRIFCFLVNKMDQEFHNV
jgi:hypothetical protein